jgi:heptosyltransferase-1
LSAIGDIVFASPLVAALRRTWPRARIAWLGEPYGEQIIGAHPDLDRFISWDRPRWQRLWRARRLRALAREVRALRRRLRAERFDLVLETQGLLKSGFLAWLTGAPRRVGLGSREGSGLLMTETLDRGGDSPTVGAEYRQLAEALGLDTRDFRMTVPLTDQARERARVVLAEADVAPGGYAVLAPFTTRPQKHWIAGAWGALAPRLDAELGLTPVVLGGPGDRDAARALVGGTPMVDLTGRTSLRESAAVIAGARLLVGVDTGLTHMGIAAGVPTVALFGSTRPYLDTGSDRAVVLYHALPCSPCRRNPTCGGRFDCMQAIPVDEVLAAAQRVLAP